MRRSVKKGKLKPTIGLRDCANLKIAALLTGHQNGKSNGWIRERFAPSKTTLIDVAKQVLRNTEWQDEHYVKNNVVHKLL